MREAPAARRALLHGLRDAGRRLRGGRPGAAPSLPGPRRQDRVDGPARGPDARRCGAARRRFRRRPRSPGRASGCSRSSSTPSACALVSGVVLALSGSAVLAALAAAELVVGIVVWEARTGRTFGNVLLGLRAARQETPYAPGLARGVPRALVLAAGHLVAGVGQWLVVGSVGLRQERARPGRGTTTSVGPSSSTSAARARRSLALAEPGATVTDRRAARPRLRRRSWCRRRTWSPSTPARP